jgi:hypothetical protein
MADLLSQPFDTAMAEQARKAASAPAAGPDDLGGDGPDDSLYSDEDLLELWQQIKRETVDQQWVFHRQWQRNIWYILGRQWIEYQQKWGGWRDKRMAAWIPRPVTNKCKETVQSIRAMFQSIALSVNIRPNGEEPEAIATAAAADDLAVLLHETHLMPQAMSEFDFWLCATGNAFLHTFLDYDIKYGTLEITSETCQGCGQTFDSTELTGAQPECPACGGTSFQPATDPLTGQPISRTELKGVPATIAMSPLEICFPNSYTRFSDVPYVVRGRWRTKRYYESQPHLKDVVSQVKWQKSPSDHSLALFTGLAQMNDLGITSGYGLDGSGRGNADTDGVAEYEVWMKPTDKYPDGLVFRVIMDESPLIVHSEDTEGLPGPLPYKDAKGRPLFTFAHATFEPVGGRILGSGPLDVIIQKQDQLNQLDSHTLLCLSRTANPVILEPKGAEIQRMTGMPGAVWKWNPLTVGGNAKPERWAGIPIDASIMSLREQYLRDIEELAGTFDILKGMKPAGVEAFSALQLLVERSQARFASVFQSRGAAYKEWVKFALELERAYGPAERTQAVFTPARKWTFKTFKAADLGGDVTVVVEDGSTTPKTSLGMRASVEHANGLGLLNMRDPDQQYKALQLFGLTKMVPTLDIHMQSALQKQSAFEKWVTNKAVVNAAVAIAQEQQALYEQALQQAQQRLTSQQLAGTTDPSSPLPAPLPLPPPPPSPLDGTPLKWQPWYSPQIHLQEFLKWANGDKVRDLMTQNPAVEQFLRMHMQEILQAMPAPTEATPAPVPQGGGMAMKNSNTNSAPLAVPGKQSPPSK